ncbi:hypothetical protein [Actinocorallia aurantiaca]|uniref:Conjugal transfer protein TraI n=1 Tax=Actinocorallia aurantiaca TaxID=46204 RepID=A0ABP6GSE9_9ACTN
MTTINPMPDPDDIERGLAQMEQYIAAHRPAPILPVAAHANTEQNEQPAGGETKRVRELRAQVAEARLLAELQDDDTPLEVDSPKVLKMRRKAAEAAKLHRLSQNPEMRAYKAARARRMFTIVLVASLTLALGWSTAGVQKFAANDVTSDTAAWWLAWLVEPFISLGLLGVVGSRSYLAIQGSPLTGDAEDTAKKIEWTFLGLSLGMNAFPYLPGVADPFDLDRLVIHILGPIVAVASVIYLSIHLKGFNDLDPHRLYAGGTPPPYRENAPVHVASTRLDTAPLVEHARQAIASGRLTPSAGIHKYRAVLLEVRDRIGTDTARAVRNEILSDP